MRDGMHIVYVHYLYGEDTGLHHAHQFAAAARHLGHRVDVYAMNLAGHEDAVSRSTTPRPQIRRVLKTRLSRYLHEPKELLWNLRYVAKELSIVRAQRPDVLLVRDHLLTASCVPVAWRLDLPLVLELNSPAEESRLYLDQYMHIPWIPEWLESWKLWRADAITVVSSPLRDFFVERYGIDSHKITVAPNGADVEMFCPDHAPEPALRRAADGGPVIGFVGSFQNWHGTDLLARMVLEVATRRPSTRFLFIGDGPEAGAVRSATASLGDRVIFTGAVSHDRIPAFVAGFDIGVLAEADFYRCPLKVVEWMAAGRAVVAPRYAPMGDLIDDGVHGLLFPPRDVESLIQVVLRLVDDGGLRRKVGSAAAARARSSLSWAHNAQRVLSACEAAVQRRRTTLACAA